MWSHVFSNKCGEYCPWRILAYMPIFSTNWDLLFRSQADPNPKPNSSELLIFYSRHLLCNVLTVSKYCLDYSLRHRPTALIYAASGREQLTDLGLLILLRSAQLLSVYGCVTAPVTGCWSTTRASEFRTRWSFWLVEIGRRRDAGRSAPADPTDSTGRPRSPRTQRSAVCI